MVWTSKNGRPVLGDEAKVKFCSRKSKKNLSWPFWEEWARWRGPGLCPLCGVQAKTQQGAVTRRTPGAAGLENQLSREHSEGQVGRDRPPDFWKGEECRGWWWGLGFTLHVPGVVVWAVQG